MPADHFGGQTQLMEGMSSLVWSLVQLVSETFILLVCLWLSSLR